MFGGSRQRRSAQVWLDALARARATDDPPTSQEPSDRTAAGVAVGAAQTRGGRAAGGGPRRSDRTVATGFGADGEPRHPRDGAPAVLGLAAADREDTAAAIDEFLREARVRPWQRELAVPVLAAALASTDGP